MQFSDYIGQEIQMTLPGIDPTVMQRVTVRGVDVGGIWIECPALVQMILHNLKQAGSLVSPIFFIPYSAITLAIVHGGGPVLNEKAFGI